MTRVHRVIDRKMVVGEGESEEAILLVKLSFFVAADSPLLRFFKLATHTATAGQLKPEVGRIPGMLGVEGDPRLTRRRVDLGRPVSRDREVAAHWLKADPTAHGHGHVVPGMHLLCSPGEHTLRRPLRDFGTFHLDTSGRVLWTYVHVESEPQNVVWCHSAHLHQGRKCADGRAGAAYRDVRCGAGTFASHGKGPRRALFLRLRRFRAFRRG